MVEILSLCLAGSEASQTGPFTSLKFAFHVPVNSFLCRFIQYFFFFCRNTVFQLCNTIKFCGFCIILSLDCIYRFINYFLTFAITDHSNTPCIGEYTHFPSLHGTLLTWSSDPALAEGPVQVYFKHVC